MGPLVPHGCHSQVFTWTDEEALKIDSKLMERRMAEFVHAFIETLQAGRSLWSAQTPQWAHTFSGTISESVVDGQVYAVYPKNDNLGNMLRRSSEGKYPELVTANFFVLLLATIMDIPKRGTVREKLWSPFGCCDS